MAIIATLLERACSQAAGLYVHSPWQSLEHSDRPALEQSWYAWVQANVSMERNDPNTALSWLRTADERLASTPNELCLAEVLVSIALLLDQADEPREALQYAEAAWKRWYRFAANPLSARDLPSIHALLSTLSFPDKPAKLADDALFDEWLADRLTLQFPRSCKLYIRFCGRLGLAEPALQAAEQFRNWLNQYLHVSSGAGGPPSFLYAELLNDIGNVYDQVGERQRALDTFREAVALLDHAGNHLAVRHLRARLKFNAGNQLAKLGRHAESIGIFQTAQAEFSALEDAEAAHRAAHAGLISRWYLGKLDGLREELEAVLVDYETDYAKSARADQQMAVRQNLDAGYRLWLTIATAETQTDERLAQRYLQQLYALREGFVDFASKWSRIAGLDAGVDILSEIDVLDSRLARYEDAVLFVLESGIQHVVLATVRPGQAGITERLRVELASEAFTAALDVLLTRYQSAVNDLIDRGISVRSAAGKEFEQACRDVWQQMPAGIQRDLAEAQIIFVAPANVGNLDEVPVELFHDGSEYLGLRKNVIRVTSLSQLHATLSENRVNVRPSGKAVVVRAADLKTLGHLRLADKEVEFCEQQLKAIGQGARILRAPSPSELLTVIRDGVDLLHYTGHGQADESGEVLILSDGQYVSARDLLHAGGAPAPISIMSSCLVGRSRQLRSGEAQGVAVALLERGARAVVAATYSLPDQVGHEFVRMLYQHWGEGSLGNAVRMARRSLAASRYHPAVWSSFIMIGHPSAAIKPAPAVSSGDLVWPASLCRFIATNAPAYAEAARLQLRSSARLPAEQIKRIDDAISAFTAQDSAFFVQTRNERQGEFTGLNAEEHLAYWALLAIGHLRFGLTEGNGKVEGQRREMLGSLLTVQRLLLDTYLLVV